MPWFPRKNFYAWPDDAIDVSTRDIIHLYSSGFAGCGYSPEARERFLASVPYPDGEMGVDARVVLPCRSMSNMTGPSGFLGSSRIGIRSTANLTSGTATMCVACSDRFE